MLGEEYLFWLQPITRDYPFEPSYNAGAMFGYIYVPKSVVSGTELRYDLGRARDGESVGYRSEKKTLLCQSNIPFLAQALMKETCLTQ